jgi:hypothetical protein
LQVAFATHMGNHLAYFDYNDDGQKNVIAGFAMVLRLFERKPDKRPANSSRPLYVLQILSGAVVMNNNYTDN